MTFDQETRESAPYAGKDLGSRSFLITPDLVMRYVNSLALSDPSRAGILEAGSPVPVIVLQEAEQLFAGNHFPNRYGELWVRQEWYFSEPIVLGDAVDVEARVVDVYQRKARTIVATEHVFKRDSRRIARSLHHNSFLVEQSRGPLDLKPRQLAGIHRPESPLTGEVFVGPVRKFTRAQCQAFYANTRNYHNDEGAAALLGFTNVVIGGGMILPYVCELIEQRFGHDWASPGSLDVKFVNVLNPDEQFEVSGRVKEPSPSVRGRTYSIEVSCRLSTGTTIAVGSATTSA